MVNNEELYDLKNDPGEPRSVIVEHPEVVAEVRAAYETLWKEAQPHLVNEDPTGFNHFTFRELYANQFGKAAAVEALQRGKALRANRNDEKPPRADVSESERLQKLREERRKRREGESPTIANPKGTTPNLVIILTDDMGWGDSATYGHKLIQTPNLDKLASQGVKFTQCYSACGVCSPSRSAILTGRTPYRNGVCRGLQPAQLACW